LVNAKGANELLPTTHKKCITDKLHHRVKKDEFTHLGKEKPYQIVRHFVFLVG